MDGDRDTPRPPELWTRVLRSAVPERELDVVAGELAEGFVIRAASAGPAKARGWYRRQVCGFVLRSVVVRGLTRRGEGERMGWLDDLGGDVRWAIRSLRKRPTFAVVAAATLARASVKPAFR